MSKHGAVMADKRELTDSGAEKGYVMANLVSLFGMAALSLLILAGGLSPAMALNCQTSAGTCYDTKTKKYRNCTTKVCTDDKGTVVSTETVLEMQSGGGANTPRPRVPLPKASTKGGVKQ